MSTALLDPRRTGPAHGATAVTGHPRHHRAGDALRAVRIFATTAFDVVVRGEYAADAGVRRAR
ncbi:hypothetical protein [uncultured Streptomyces sp.]|uniref:hypothetical protein n=1 Tax=uncultured Streptomyces sp. TaxID=174707 RepID=UPI0026329223|nr:hypothetical protein [uncultured Streptomyces sp.]